MHTPVKLVFDVRYDSSDIPVLFKILKSLECCFGTETFSDAIDMVLFGKAFKFKKHEKKH